MLMVDLKARPVAMLLVASQDYEGHHVIGLIEAANLPPGLTIVGDKAYDDYKLRFRLTALGFETCFPTKSNRKESRPTHTARFRIPVQRKTEAYCGNSRAKPSEPQP